MGKWARFGFCGDSSLIRGRGGLISLFILSKIVAEKNIRSNLHNINRMSRILFMKWRKKMLATASENIWRELCFHRVKMASRAAKKKTLLLQMMMQDEELPLSYERRINYHSCTGDAPIFNINANSLFSSILFNLFTTLFRHRHLQTRTCRIVGA